MILKWLIHIASSLFLTLAWVVMFTLVTVTDWGDSWQGAYAYFMMVVLAFFIAFSLYTLRPRNTTDPHPEHTMD